MAEKSSILIVDDNFDNIRVLGTVLRKNDYRVMIAQSGKQALHSLEVAKIDLILLDVMMPGMDGFATCQKIKAHPDWKRIPIIFLTAKVGEAEIVQGFKLGAVDYITKPFNVAILLERVKTHIQLHHYHNILQEQAYIDGLTQIPNRLRFEKVIYDEWHRALRNATPLAVLMIDIDHFKMLNDTYGHVMGDYVLKQVACTLARLIKRTGDFVARYGGEEFVVILPDSKLRETMMLAESMRVAVEKLAIENENTALGSLTISLGATSFIPTPALSPVQLVDAADQQLFLAKKNGRNQVYGEDLIE